MAGPPGFVRAQCNGFAGQRDMMIARINDKVAPLPIINYRSGPFFISPQGGLAALGLRAPVLPDVEAGVGSDPTGEDGFDAANNSHLSYHVGLCFWWVLTRGLPCRLPAVRHGAAG